MHSEGVQVSTLMNLPLLRGKKLSSLLSHRSSPPSENKRVNAQKKRKDSAAALSTEAFSIRKTAPSLEA